MTGVTRQAHVMPVNKTTGGYPSLILTFDTETRPRDCCERSYGVGEDIPQELILGWAVFRDLRKSTHAGKDDDIEFTKADQFWDFVETKTQSKKILYVINHNIAFDLMVCEFERSLDNRGWTPSNIVVPDPHGPFFITYKRGDRTLQFINLANWWGLRSLKTIGSIIGEYKGEVDPTAERYRHAVSGSRAWRELSIYCHQDAVVVAEAVRYWCEFCLAHDFGRFAFTQAGQSLAAYRHRFMDHKIYLHNNEKATRLERDAYLGARTQVFRVGTFNGQTYTYADINSLYPSVMRDHRFPTKLVKYREDKAIGETAGDRLSYLRRQCASELAVIADVTCDTSCDLPEYLSSCLPTRRDGKLIYPAGKFTTTLCGPELVTALGRGLVVDCHRVAVYEQEKIFTRYVDELYELRLKYKREGNLVFVDLVKIFMNSLYGKFGQHTYEWLPVELDYELRAGVVTYRDPDTLEFKTMRRIGNVVEQKLPTMKEGRYSFPAIAAYVTSYARSRISRLYELAGPRDVYYMDTDSLFVTPQGLSRLRNAGELDDHRLGKLKIEQESDCLTIRAPKDYSFGTTRKLKGVRLHGKDTIEVSPNQWEQTQFRGFSGAMRANDPNHAVVRRIRKTISGTYTKGVIDHEGWTHPLVIDDATMIRWEPPNQKMENPRL